MCIEIPYYYYMTLSVYVVDTFMYDLINFFWVFFTIILRNK